MLAIGVGALVVLGVFCLCWLIGSAAYILGVMEPDGAPAILGFYILGATFIGLVVLWGLGTILLDIWSMIHGH